MITRNDNSHPLKYAGTAGLLLYAIPLAAELAFCLWLSAKNAQLSTSR
jgi:hypothetical protein